jgi:hypothetical protein
MPGVGGAPAPVIGIGGCDGIPPSGDDAGPVAFIPASAPIWGVPGILIGPNGICIWGGGFWMFTRAWVMLSRGFIRQPHETEDWEGLGCGG